MIDPHGRGSADSPPNPFERLHVVDDPEGIEDMRRSDPFYLNPESADPDWQPPSPKTQFFRDDSQSVISKNNSPDIPFDHSLNPYRGCEHGCAYCYARRTHEYLGWNAGIDFESKILVKENAAELLQDELNRMREPPAKLNCSGVTDPYQPVERKLEVTRSCLAVLAEMRQAVTMVTKNHLITRDIDLLGDLAQFGAAAAAISITSLDRELATALEPRASSPRMRLDAVRQLRAGGIPAGIMLAPVIPGLNDHEIPAIIEAAADAGAQFVGYTTLRLPGNGASVFEGWLREHVSEEKAASVLERTRSLRGGVLNSSQFGDRMRGKGALADNIRTMIRTAVSRHGLNKRIPQPTNSAFRRISRAQPELF